MSATTMSRFILIDDDRINNIICSRIILKAIPDASVQMFTDPEKGLNYIETAYAAEAPGAALLLLDINMPSLSGWDVLERIRHMPDDIKEHIKTYMLSSSLNSSDIERAGRNPLVSGYLTKPFSEKVLNEIRIDK